MRYLFLFCIIDLIILSLAQAGLPQPGDLIKLKNGERILIEGTLGEGAYGVVFRGVNVQDPNKKWALKFYLPSKQGIVTLPGEHIDGLLRGKAHVDEQSRFLLLMPLAETDLRSEALKADTPEKKLSLANEVFRDILPILKRIELNGINHGDIKVENILRYKSQWVLADLDGLKKVGDVQKLFTPSYAPTEVRTFKPTHESTDAFAFARTLSMLLIGKKMPDSILEQEKWPSLTKEQVLKAYPEFSSDPRLAELLNYIERALSFKADQRLELLKTFGFQKLCRRVHQ